MGALNDQGTPTRSAPRPATKAHDDPKTTVPVYLREVRAGIFCGPSGSGPGRRAWLRAAWPAP